MTNFRIKINLQVPEIRYNMTPMTNFRIKINLQVPEIRYNLEILKTAVVWYAGIRGPRTILLTVH